MLILAEYEICPANKSQITNIANSFLLNSAEHEIFSANKHENANNILHFHISRKFHAQLCLARKKYLQSTFLAMHVVYVRSMNCTGE